MTAPTATTADTSGKSDVSYSDSSLYERSTAHKDFYSVMDRDTDASSGLTEYKYQSKFQTWHAYYRTHPVFAGMIDKLGNWTIGREIKFKKKSDEETAKKIKGIGKDTFRSILLNMIKVAFYNGDSFAEIIKGSGLFGLGKGKLANLKPLNPGTIDIVVNELNMIIGYDQMARVGGIRKSIHRFPPEEIFHLCWDRTADEVHGIPTAEKLEPILKAEKESFLQTKVLMKRHVQPVQIYSLGTDSDTETQAVKTKIDNAYQNTENVYVAENVIKKIEQVGVPQFSTLDPMPWRKSLKRDLVTGGGVPEVVMGWGEETTESSSKIIHIGFEQEISGRQFWVEENVLSQLGMEIELESPPSLEVFLQQDNKKDGPVQGEKKSELDPNTQKK